MSERTNSNICGRAGQGTQLSVKENTDLSRHIQDRREPHWAQSVHPALRQSRDHCPRPKCDIDNKNRRESTMTST